MSVGTREGSPDVRARLERAQAELAEARAHRSDLERSLEAEKALTQKWLARPAAPPIDFIPWGVALLGAALGVVLTTVLLHAF